MIALLLSCCLLDDSLLRPDYDAGIWASKNFNVLAPKLHNHLAREIGEKAEVLRKDMPEGSPFLVINVRIVGEKDTREFLLWHGDKRLAYWVWMDCTREEAVGTYLQRAVGEAVLHHSRLGGDK